MPFRIALCIALGGFLAWPALARSENPAAPGFDQEGSDARAIEIADRAMERMGGRQAWDETRYIIWNFLGRRRHAWDKQTGDIRIEGTERESGEPYLILMNLHTGEGRAWIGGREIVDDEAHSGMMERGESLWINDSYWMFMPYKLKDSGVTLRYEGEAKMQDGRAAEVLQLTFQDVGRTPENRYLVYVAEDSGLVEQWDYYASAEDAEPDFQRPWHNWQPYGGILLSDNRGDIAHSDIAVLDELPAGVLDSPEPVDWQALIP